MNFNRPSFIPDMPRDRWVKWIAFYAALLYSMRHVAHFFNSMDTGWEGWGWIAAFAIDATIAAAAHGSDRQQRGNIVTTTVIVFTLVSIYANLDYTLATALGAIVHWDLIWTLDYWQLGKAITVASPPLLIFGLAEILKETEPDHSPGTALATANPPASQVANPQPDVKVANPQTPQLGNRSRRAIGMGDAIRVPRRQPANKPATQVANRQPAPAANLPTPDRKITHQLGNLATATLELEEVDESWQDDKLPTDDNPKQVSGFPIPKTDLDHKLVQAVMVYAQAGSYAKAVKRMGELGTTITSEGIRLQVVEAYKEDPEWVAAILPADKLPKV